MIFDFILYECPVDFPKRIPTFLAADGLTVAADGKRMAKIQEGENSFKYSISDGTCRLDLVGCEGEGSFHFYLWDSSGSNPRRLGKAFRQRVVAILTREGTFVWDDSLEKQPNKTPQTTTGSSAPDRCLC